MSTRLGGQGVGWREGFLAHSRPSAWGPAAPGLVKAGGAATSRFHKHKFTSRTGLQEPSGPVRGEEPGQRLPAVALTPVSKQEGCVLWGRGQLSRLRSAGGVIFIKRVGE